MIFVRQFSKHVRKNLPKAVREQLWLRDIGKKYQAKCTVQWCNNTINVYDFNIGHNHPVSKGGTNALDNLQPICSRCNSSMGNKYTIDQWNIRYKIFKKKELNFRNHFK